MKWSWGCMIILFFYCNTYISQKDDMMYTPISNNNKTNQQLLQFICLNVDFATKKN